MKCYSKKGFTLVEIMVAVSIFVIVAFIVTSTILAILDASRRANKIRLIIDNMNFALDSMASKLKFGDRYNVSDSELSFIDRNGLELSYCLDNGQIIKCENGGLICGGNETNCEPITSDEITVTKLRFEDRCPECGVKEIVILTAASSTMRDNQTVAKLEFQTAVSQAISQ